MRRLFATLAGISLIVTVLCAGTAPAQDTAAEHIARYDSTIHIERSGVLDVVETIAYDFGSTEHHGIFRDIPRHTRYDDRYDRVIRISDVRVTASAGTPTKLEASDGDVEHLKIGDPHRTITGEHTYTIAYRVEGALTAYDDHDELVWNAIGQGWEVPIGPATVRVDAPAAFTSTGCFAGPVGSRLPCDGSAPAGNTAVFQQAGLAPGGALTVVVGLPTGAVTVGPPLLEERFSLDRAFARTPATVSLLIGLLALLLGGIGWLVWRRGRDRRFVGSGVDAAFGTESGADTAAPVLDRDPIPVEFVPPDGLRPGQIGTLLDERANPLDVTATIVDLGARGHLTITELAGHGLFKRTDWQLTKTHTDDDKLLPYESTLLGALFKDGDEVKLSELKNHFVTTLKSVQHQLYDDMVARRWYLHRPDNVRAMWLAIGIALTVIGGIVTGILASRTHAALPALALPVAGLVLLASSRWMPQRTAKGSAARRRAIGFRHYIEQAETDRSRFAEHENLFTEYLAYAVVFGVTGKWARAFAGLDDEVPQPAFFISPHPFTVASFESSMHSFTTSSTGAIASTPSGSGGGGFSGGGFGGGGGGSW